MKDRDCVAFLQWFLPKLNMRWEGFRKVRRTVCKRIQRRIEELGLPDIAAYRSHLEQTPSEWSVLDGFCRIPISRFYRDRELFRFLENVALPELAQAATQRGEKEIRCWSAGSASGEEAYTLNILWRLELSHRFPDLSLRIIATDTDDTMLGRARDGCYGTSSLKRMPADWHIKAFDPSGKEHCLRKQYRQGVEFYLQDIRSQTPDAPFHLILCRNLVFTYFDKKLQHIILQRMLKQLIPGAILIIGIHETLPEGFDNLVPYGPRTQKPMLFRLQKQDQ
jgi:chemotaxis protein methyltransferase CheR